jgi:hypothetical protein
MNNGAIASFERDRALVEAMRFIGEPVGVIDDYLLCLDLDEAEREELRRIARWEDGAGPTAANGLGSADMTSGDVIEMNPLTSQPQRSRSRR